MARLVVTARDRASQHAALSWGVLSGLIRSLDLRDRRASRHAAAVAAFSRDIAQASGFKERECDSAHTAGQLHDIGRFGLSHRVMERGRTLTEQDWDTIRRHREIGADMLRDFGLYGPSRRSFAPITSGSTDAGIRMAFRHPRSPSSRRSWRSRGVYDTLTADDTYRTPVSSFDALTELRRVSGTQLDGLYVEALAMLLAGRGGDYRHADARASTRSSKSSAGSAMPPAYRRAGPRSTRPPVSSRRPRLDSRSPVYCLDATGLCPRCSGDRTKFSIC
jgi:HD domain